MLLSPWSSSARAKLREQELQKPVLRDSLSPPARRYIADAVRVHLLLEHEETRMARLDTEALDVKSVRADRFDETSRGLASGRVALGKDGRKQVQKLMHAIGLSLAPGSPACEEAAYKATEGWHLALRCIRDRMNGDYVPTPATPESPAELRAPSPRRRSRSRCRCKASSRRFRTR
jgi:hypothetical protein